ncbi:Actin-related protein 1 [Armadillidium nasatum]|uniref:Actin-related protein 1 n=1 Tax=Armadillidium nasatum TaxID=96803 RepID=A0A5N5SVE6_9CRUS|nr:Actin-related protein 1 [Armadillidium nasatum]
MYFMPEPIKAIGRPKHVRVMAGALEGDLFVGPKAEEHRGLLSIRYPMEHGIVTDWNDMERIWQYIYSKDQLQTFPEEVSEFVKLQVVFDIIHHQLSTFLTMTRSFKSPKEKNKRKYATGRTTGVILKPSTINGLTS